MTNNKPEKGSQKLSAATQTGQKTTQNTKAPAKKTTRRKKDGNADPTSPAKAEAVNSQASSRGIEVNSEPIFYPVTGIEEMDIKLVEKELRKACKQTEKQSDIAIKASALVLSYAWVTGKLLNRAKALLKKKGEFGEWREETLVSPGLMSVKTAQRYMEIARKWESLETLHGEAPNLWKAYQAAGILPCPDDVDETGITDYTDDPPSRPPDNPLAEYVAKFSELQKMLRHMSELKGKIKKKIPKGQQQLINEMINQIIEFTDQVRGEVA